MTEKKEYPYHETAKWEIERYIQGEGVLEQVLSHLRIIDEPHSTHIPPENCVALAESLDRAADKMEETGQSSVYMRWARTVAQELRDRANKQDKKA